MTSGQMVRVARVASRAPGGVAAPPAAPALDPTNAPGADAGCCRRAVEGQLVADRGEQAPVDGVEEVVAADEDLGALAVAGPERRWMKADDVVVIGVRGHVFSLLRCRG